MKRRFLGWWRFGPRGDGGPRGSGGPGPGPGYRLRARDLGKIHRAASAGDVARVQQLLLLGQSGPDDRDKRHRTALHLACAGGHKEVVTLLVERKCQLNLFDSENRTALIKAVQCQKEECATILLEHGADPNLQDISGNTALHYAASSQNRALVAKLLAHDADIQISNKDHLTPVLLAFTENKQEMADFLEKESKRYELEEMQSTCHVTSEYALENIPKNSLQNNNPGVDDNSEEESLSRLSRKPGIGDSWPTSDDDFDFEPKTVQRPNLTKLMAAFEQSQKNKANDGIVIPPNRVSFEDDNSGSANEGVIETFPRSSVKVQDTSHAVFPSPEPILKPLKSFTTLDLPDERPVSPELEKEKNGINTIENVSQAQTNKDNLPCAGEAPQKRSDMLSALELGEEEDIESPWDSEQSISESLPQTYVDHLSATANQREKSTLNGQVEDVFYIPSFMSGSSNFKMAKIDDTRNRDIPVADVESLEKYHHLKPSIEVQDYILTQSVRIKDVQTSQPDLPPELDLDLAPEKDQERLNEHENNHLQVDEEKKKNNNSEMKVSENSYEGAATGLVQPIKGRNTILQQFPILENEESDRSIIKASYDHKKVRHQINSMDDLGDLTESYETTSEDCELPSSNYENSILVIEKLGKDCKDLVSLLKIRNAVLSYERFLELTKKHCEVLTGKNKIMRNKVSGLQKELSEAKETKSELEHQNVELEQELYSLRFSLQQEEEKRQNAEILLEKIREHLWKAEEQCNKEVEAKQQLEFNLRTLNMELKTVSDRHDKEKHMLQDEIVRLKLEVNTMKNQNQKKEKKYLEDIKMIKERNEDLQRTIKRNEETFTETLFQSNAQINILTDKNAMLKSQLEQAKQNKDTLETELDTYRSRLATATWGHDLSKASKRELELSFQRAKDEWSRLQHKMNFDVATLKDTNEDLSQQLSTMQAKLNNLEIELHHTRDSLKEKTSALECIHRHLSQTHGQKKEIEHVDHNEQGKVNKYIGKQESLEERLSHLQNENVLLRQQLDDAHNKMDSQEKTVMNIHGQFQDTVKRLQAESKKHGQLEERNKELINDCYHLKETICQYESETAEREVVVRQLQQELADSLKKQSMSEASLDVVSRHCNNLKDETKDLKRKIDYLSLKLERASSKSLANKLKHLQRDNERLAEIISTKLLLESQQRSSLLSTLTTRPVLEPPWMGHLTHSARLPPRENILFPSANPQPGDSSIETYLFQMQEQLEKNINRELEEGAAELESRFYRSTRRSIAASNSTQDLLSREYVDF